MEITTIEELYEQAVLIQTDEIIQDYYSSRVLKLNPIIWRNVSAKVFNTCNGILAFTDELYALHIIPNFPGLTSLLKENGYSQSYILTVPLANGSFSPISHKNHWMSLKREFLQCSA